MFSLGLNDFGLSLIFVRYSLTGALELKSIGGGVEIEQRNYCAITAADRVSYICSINQAEVCLWLDAYWRDRQDN